MSGIESALSFLKNYDFLNLGWSSVELAILYGIVILVVLAVLVLIIVKCCKSGSKKQDLSESETAGAAEILSIKADENANNPKKENKEKKRKKELKLNHKVLAKWQEKMPQSDDLLKYWQVMNDDEKETVGNLSRENNWADAYLAECGKKEESYQMFLLLWRYQGEKSDELLKMLMRELANLHIEQSMAACRLISQICDERIVPLLLLALLKPDKYAPARVAEALAAFGIVAARALAALYRKVEATEYKLLVLDAMGQLHKLCPLSVLKEAVASSNDEIRKKAAEIIGIVHPEDALELLYPMMVDSDGRIRSAAAAALGQIGGEKSYVILKEMQEKDPDWQVKSTCQSFVSGWENAIQDRVAFDEVDQWMAENTHIAAEDEIADKNVG